MIFEVGVPVLGSVSSLGVPDPYTPPDGNWNITGSIRVSSLIQVGAGTMSGSFTIEGSHTGNVEQRMVTSTDTAFAGYSARNSASAGFDIGAYGASAAGNTFGEARASRTLFAMGTVFGMGTVTASDAFIATGDVRRMTWESDGDILVASPVGKTFGIIRGTSTLAEGYGQALEILGNTAAADLAVVVRQNSSTGSASFVLRNSDSPNSVYSLGKYGNGYGTNLITIDATAAVDVSLGNLNLLVGSGGAHVIAAGPVGTSIVFAMAINTANKYTPVVIDGTTYTTSFYQKGVGTGQTIGIAVANTTAAAVGAQQYSPMVVQEGQGWKTDATAASRSVRFGSQVVPVQGAADPTGDLRWYASINGAAWGTAILKLGNTGVLTVSASLQGKAGATVASAAQLPVLLDGDSILVSGTNNIDFLPGPTHTTAPRQTGSRLSIIFSGVLNINHLTGAPAAGWAQINTTTGAAVATAAGKRADFVLMADGIWYQMAVLAGA